MESVFQRVKILSNWPRSSRSLLDDALTQSRRNLKTFRDIFEFWPQPGGLPFHWFSRRLDAGPVTLEDSSGSSEQNDFNKTEKIAKILLSFSDLCWRLFGWKSNHSHRERYRCISLSLYPWYFHQFYSLCESKAWTLYHVQFPVSIGHQYAKCDEEFRAAHRTNRLYLCVHVFPRHSENKRKHFWWFHTLYQTHCLFKYPSACKDYWVCSHWLQRYNILCWYTFLHVWSHILFTFLFWGVK